MSTLTLAPAWMAASSVGAGGGSPCGDVALVRELQRTGDEDLFRELVHAYRERVFRVASAVLGPGRVAEAEDLAQEAFLLVFRKLGSFRGECAFSTWLLRLTRNLAIDRRRLADLRRPHLSDEALAGLPARDESTDPEQAASASERRARVLACLERLGEPQRTAVHLYYWQGLPVAEISELLELTPEAVKSCLHRARQQLGRALGPGYGRA